VSESESDGECPSDDLSDANDVFDATFNDVFDASFKAASFDCNGATGGDNVRGKDDAGGDLFGDAPADLCSDTVSPSDDVSHDSFEAASLKV